MPYPAKITPKVIEEVLSRIAQGETLASLGRELGFHPQSWADRMRADEGLAIAYAEAREIGHDALADQTLEIADGTRPSSEHVQLSKLRIETRLKLLACWSPKKYGNKQTVDVGNKEGETLKVETTPVDPMVLSALTEALFKKDDK
jgi:hypothetical protein